MKVALLIDELELRKILEREFCRQLPEGAFDLKKIQIETQSRQNYRSEWESGAGVPGYIQRRFMSAPTTAVRVVPRPRSGPTIHYGEAGECERRLRGGHPAQNKLRETAQ